MVAARRRSRHRHMYLAGALALSFQVVHLRTGLQIWRSQQMTINWNKPITNKSVWNYFLKMISPDSKVTYWKHFRFGRKEYLMTFNNLYEIQP